MSYAAESGFDVDASDQFAKIIRELDVEFLHSVNAVKGKDKLIEEVPITDVEGTKQLLARLGARASAGKKRGKS
jgi:hypothetical protein